MVSAVPPSVRTPPVGLGGWFRNVQRGVSSLLEGLAVTLSWMFRRPVTIQYPDKLERPLTESLPEAYRGILEVDVRLCTGCLLCEKTCPIACITVEVEKNPAGGRDLKKFDIDVSRCMYCGLCSEPCPTGAIAHSAEFEAAAGNISDLTLHFVDSPVPVARHKAGEAPERAPRGSILKGVIQGYRGRRGPAPRPAQPAPAPEGAPAPASPPETGKEPTP